jgi:hypothetical protein
MDRPPGRANTEAERLRFYEGHMNAGRSPDPDPTFASAWTVILLVLAFNFLVRTVPKRPQVARLARISHRPTVAARMKDRPSRSDGRVVAPLRAVRQHLPDGAAFPATGRGGVVSPWDLVSFDEGLNPGPPGGRSADRKTS